MARAGMATMLLELRRRTNAGTADYNVNGVAYFTDDQLEDIADRYRVTLKSIPLHAIPQRVASDYEYKEYPIPGQLQWIEENQTDSGWALRDNTGGTILASAYTVNYQSRLITFTSDTDNADYYLDCRNYDLNQAAADIWDSKSSFVANAVNWQSDNHRIEASSEYQHCLAMAKFWRGKSGMKTAKMVRTDEK